MKLAFAMYRRPYAFYLDRGQHFYNDVLVGFLRSEEIAADFSSSGASKSTDIIEVYNKLLEEVLRKDLHIDMKWDRRISKGASSVNSRIIGHLNYLSKVILFGYVQKTSAITATLLALSGRDIYAWIAELKDQGRYAKVVREYLLHLADVYDSVVVASNLRKDTEVERYNRGIKLAVHHVGDLVMLYQKKSGKL